MAVSSSPKVLGFPRPGFPPPPVILAGAAFTTVEVSVSAMAPFSSAPVALLVSTKRARAVPLPPYPQKAGDR
jgi:hypothetical protein